MGPAKPIKFCTYLWDPHSSAVVSSMYIMDLGIGIIHFSKLSQISIRTLWYNPYGVPSLYMCSL